MRRLTFRLSDEDVAILALQAGLVRLSSICRRVDAIESLLEMRRAGRHVFITDASAIVWWRNHTPPFRPRALLPARCATSEVA